MDYFKRVLAVSDKGCGLIEVGRSAGWWWAMRGIVILTERPTLLERDAEHRLHSHDGPALLYPDGWGIWASHGVRVPRQVIEAPETLTADEVLHETNAEVRRVMIERLGADRLMAMVDAQVVHVDKDSLGHRRRLLRLDLQEDEPLVMVEVVNSTPEPDGSMRNYLLRVPPAIQTCQSAVAWTFDVDARSYRVSVET